MRHAHVKLGIEYLLFAVLMIVATVLLLPSTDFEFNDTSVEVRTAKNVAVTKDYKLLFMGDTMMARTIGDAVLKGTDPYKNISGTLAGYDLKLANVETTIAPADTAVQAKGKLYTFNAPLAAIDVLKKHIDVAILANNHTKDYGSSATAAMLDAFAAKQLLTVGAGKNVDAAFAPLMVTLGDGTQSPEIKVAFIGLNDIENEYTVATSSLAGSAYFNADRIKASIASAKDQKADAIIAIAHWGVEYTNNPNAEQKKWAHFLVDNGVDAVIGGHPHVIQPNETYNGKPIVYSMGNFIFDGMSGDALHGQMISLDIHVDATKKSVKNAHISNKTVAVSLLENIPITIDGSGFPSVKK